jgi:hypothetical protein
MAHYVPVIVNEKHEYLGLFSVLTSVGHVLIIAEEPSRLTELLDLAYQGLFDPKETKRKLGYWELPKVTNFPAAVQLLTELDPSLSQAATFIQDSDPFFARILDELRQNASPEH